VVLIADKGMDEKTVFAPEFTVDLLILYPPSHTLPGQCHKGPSEVIPQLRCFRQSPYSVSPCDSGMCFVFVKTDLLEILA